MRILLAWTNRDEALRIQGDPTKAETLAPALRAASAAVDRVVLLSNLPEGQAEEFVESVEAKIPIEVRAAPLSSPVDYAEIHAQAIRAITDLRREHGRSVKLSFLLNSGTPPMGSVWLLLGKSQFRAELLAWSTYEGKLIKVDVPFAISADFVPDLLSDTDEALRSSSGELPPRDAAFSDIVHRCKPMAELVRRAQRVALHFVPVLIEGETGTGKELFARAIHQASPRKGKPFIAVNCAAIPEGLIESELFGHVRGAFTGAVAERAGYFREANGGTLLLDEIGELPLPLQVKLLRPLQEGTVQAVGSSDTHKVDVRVIAATHRDLLAEIRGGTFREDLFYRLAVAVLHVPPLREREGDLQLLIDSLLGEINLQNQSIDIAPRGISAEARNRLREHHWTGNVRELANTLRRAVTWSMTDKLGTKDIDEALFRHPAAKGTAEIMERPIGGDFKLDDLLDEVQLNYLERAMEMAQGKKGEAARLLGLNSHQVLSKRMQRLQIEEH